MNGPVFACAVSGAGPTPSRVTAYIDYGSPYSYQAWSRITQHPDRYPAAAFDWIPVSAGHLFAMDEGKPNVAHPNLWAYNLRDLERWARALDIPYAMNPVFPQRTIEAARVFHHLAARDPDIATANANATAATNATATAWSAACFHAHWVALRDISKPATLVALANQHGLYVDVTHAIQDDAAKKGLIDATNAAYAAGAPGVPYFVIDGDGYWGHDRLDWVLARLAGDDAPPFA